MLKKRGGYVMFIRQKNKAIKIVSFTRKSNGFFTSRMSTSLSISDHGEKLATHVEIRNGETESILPEKVISLIRQHPDCHLTFMTPTTLMNHANINKKRHLASKGFIYPGHIHSACTDKNGDIMEKGDVSFSTTGQSFIQTLTPVYDSRLKGYQPIEMALLMAKFTSSAHEIENWANFAKIHRDYSLYVLARRFKSQEDKIRYLKSAEIIRALNAKHHYALMSYYKTGTDEIEQARNCVTINKELNEHYFNIRLNLGDNPTPQTAYMELIKKFYPSQGISSQIIGRGGILSEVHYEKEMRERYSLVI